ncbi:hypothetical protein BLNAU_11214 [Blattamonas nauphoetae]|uniref:Uncharacterized protein n=1 Tax=Blattamonas nauphoetae TaxID=2049346 RepID=A0ABQ9XN21_9EUKA|nr:hypothetical protein BLNAU_11214 [Blattamonas nauphoetae]
MNRPHLWTILAEGKSADIYAASIGAIQLEMFEQGITVSSCVTECFMGLVSGVRTTPALEWLIVSTTLSKKTVAMHSIANVTNTVGISGTSTTMNSSQQGAILSALSGSARQPFVRGYYPDVQLGDSHLSSNIILRKRFNIARECFPSPVAACKYRQQSGNSSFASL